MYFAVVCDCGFLPSPGLRGLCVGVGVLGTVGWWRTFAGLVLWLLFVGWVVACGCLLVLGWGGFLHISELCGVGII